MTKTFSKQTRRLYIRWIYRINNYYNIHPDKLSEQQVLNFLASLSREYAQATINEAAIALRHYYRCKGKDYDLPTKSLKAAQKLPQAILNRKEAMAVKEVLHPYYQRVFDEIYRNLTPPSVAVKQYSSRSYHDNKTLHINTLYYHIKKARDKIGLNKLASPTTIYQAGIIHFLQDTNDVRAAAQKTGLSDKRILYYYKIAQSQNKKAPLA